MLRFPVPVVRSPVVRSLVVSGLVVPRPSSVVSSPVVRSRVVLCPRFSVSPFLSASRPPNVEGANVTNVATSRITH